MRLANKFFALGVAAAFFAPGAATPRPRRQQGSQPPTPAAAAPHWEAYTYPGEEFSVALPEMPVVYNAVRRIKNRPNENGKARAFAAYADGVVYLVWSYDGPRDGEDVDHFGQYFRTYEVTSSVRVFGREEARLGGFAGRRYVVRDERFPDGGNEFSYYVYRARKHAYVIMAYGAGETDAAVRRFFGSFAISDRPAGMRIADVPAAKPEGRKQEPEKAEPDTRKAEPDTQRGSAEAEQPAAAAAAAAANAANADGAVDYTRIFTARDVTRKAIPVFRPEPPYTEEARKNQVTGTVTLRMIFNSDGTISNIIAINRLPRGLTENAIKAARLMKFIPALKDGRRVSQWATVQYNFNIY